MGDAPRATNGSIRVHYVSHAAEFCRLSARSGEFAET
jgi:hypothetical protein